MIDREIRALKHRKGEIKAMGQITVVDNDTMENIISDILFHLKI